MSWILRYRCRLFLKSSLCAAPIASMAAALLAAPLLRMVDECTQWPWMNFGLQGSRIVVGALATSLLTIPLPREHRLTPIRNLDEKTENLI